jgi:hypothetical protein
MMTERIIKLFKFTSTKPLLGRWSLKTCDELSTSINAIYQNRDHCGDTICKNPVQAIEYITDKEVQKIKKDINK